MRDEAKPRCSLRPQPPPPPPASEAALGRQPTVESRIAINLQPVEKFAVEQIRQRPQPLRRKRCNTLLGRPRDLQRIDAAILEVQADRVLLRFDPFPSDDAPDL